MIQILLPALFAGILIGCGGDKPESKINEQIETDITSSDLNASPVGGIHVGTTPSASSASLPSIADHQKPRIIGKPKVPSPVINPVVPTRPRPPRESVEVDFMDEFYDGEPGNLRVVPAPLVPVPPQTLNDIGNAVNSLITTPARTTIDNVIDVMIPFFSPLLSRDTGLFNMPGTSVHPMAFWAASGGPGLLQYFNRDRDCGRNVVNENSRKTRCFLVMMIGAHVPVPEGYKPRDVSRQIGLFDFCEQNKEGIANELRLRATVDPAPYDGWTFYGDGLPNHWWDSGEVTRHMLTNAFAATWLSFCPNLVEVTEPAPRLMVFKHAVYRMQIASLHEGGNVDYGYSNSAVNRATAFPDLVNFLLTDRIQLLRRPMGDIRFAGAESVGIGRGIKESFANEVGNQIFKYSMPTEAGIHGDRNRVLFTISDSNEYVQLAEGALEAAGRRGSRPVVERYYKAAGRFFGWMLINRLPIPEDLSLMFFARLMGREIGWEAIKVYDFDKYNRFSRCLRGSTEEIRDAGCTILGMYAIHFKDENDVVDPWPATPEERRNVLNDATTNLVTFASEDEFGIFSQGIYDVIPRHIFECGMTTKDLRLSIVGVRTVNAAELVETMTFGVGYTGSEIQIVWLKRFIGTLDENQLQAFVEFATGRRRAGPGGFRAEPINVKRMSDYEISQTGGDPNSPRVPPKSHVCFRQIELPAYADEATLFDKMAYSLGESEFGMV